VTIWRQGIFGNQKLWKPMNLLSKAPGSVNQAINNLGSKKKF
jgi:hypothetical protein